MSIVYLKKEIVDKLCIADPEIPFSTHDGVFGAKLLLEQYLAKHWTKQLEKQGFSASVERGVKVDITRRNIEDYITKLGKLPQTWGKEQEMTQSNSKGLHNN